MDRLTRPVAALTMGLLLLPAAFLLARPGRAQAPPPPAGTPPPPAAPAAPAAAPSAPAAPTPEEIEKTVSDALAGAAAVTAQKEAGRAAYNVNSAFVFSGMGAGDLSNKRLDVDLKNTGLRDALKRVLEDAKVSYQLDDDVPNDPRVTLKVSNAPLPAVLDLLTEANGVGWRSEVKGGAPFAATTVTVGPNGATKIVSPQPKAGAPGESAPRVHVGKSVAPLPHSFRLGVMDLKGLPGGDMKIPVPPLAPGTPYIRHFSWREQRATFTCPNCHNTVTILRTPENVHCPKCGRVFEDDWKVCPYDGTKRPARKDEWHYCPICGKQIKLEEQTSWVTEPFAPRVYVSAADAPDGQNFLILDGDLLPDPGEGADDTSDDVLIPALIPALAAGILL